jgi:hypothetical protein
VADGINAMRLEGVEALRQYRTEYDERLKTFADTPPRDWTTDTADAARYIGDRRARDRPDARGRVARVLRRPCESVGAPGFAADAMMDSEEAVGVVAPLDIGEARVV